MFLEHVLIFWSYSILWYIYTNPKQILNNEFKVAIYSLKIQFFVLPITGLVFYYIYSNFDQSYLLDTPEFSLYELKQWGYMFIWIEILFYHTHRLLHHPKLYFIHKLHHTYKKTFPWVSLYSSITENILLNFLPVITAPLVVQLNIYYIFIWVAITTLSSVISHGDGLYNLHSLHHKYFNVNYGPSPILDILYGTFKAYDSSPTRQPLLETHL